MIIIPARAITLSLFVVAPFRTPPLEKGGKKNEKKKKNILLRILLYGLFVCLFVCMFYLVYQAVLMHNFVTFFRIFCCYLFDLYI